MDRYIPWSGPHHLKQHEHGIYGLPAPREQGRLANINDLHSRVVLSFYVYRWAASSARLSGVQIHTEERPGFWLGSHAPDGSQICNLLTLLYWLCAYAARIWSLASTWSFSRVSIAVDIQGSPCTLNWYICNAKNFGWEMFMTIWTLPTVQMWLAFTTPVLEPFYWHIFEGYSSERDRFQSYS